MTVESPEAFYKRVTAIKSCWDGVDAVIQRDADVARESSPEEKIANAWLREVWRAGYNAAQCDSNPFRDPDEPYEVCPYPEDSPAAGATSPPVPGTSTLKETP